MQEHEQNIQKIFNALRNHNLKIQIDKCNFLAKSENTHSHRVFRIQYIVSTDEIKPNPNKITAIQKLKLPEKPKQIKFFLGITGYYSKFIKDYEKIAHGIIKYLKRTLS